MKRGYFAGGCFWCVTPAFRMPGVVRVVSGYSGGEEEDPAYEDVKAQKTGHRETVMVEYEPGTVSYGTLLDEVRFAAPPATVHVRWRPRWVNRGKTQEFDAPSVIGNLWRNSSDTETLLFLANISDKEKTVTLANDGFAGRTVTLPPRAIQVL